MRHFKFVPGYYEWHLKDIDTDETLHVMDDPIDDLFDEEGLPIPPEELKWFCKTELETADQYYECDEEYNGLLLNDLLRLDEQETEEAATVMFNKLTEYYINEE